MRSLPLDGGPQEVDLEPEFLVLSPVWAPPSEGREMWFLLGSVTGSVLMAVVIRWLNRVKVGPFAGSESRREP